MSRNLQWIFALSLLVTISLTAISRNVPFAEAIAAPIQETASLAEEDKKPDLAQQLVGTWKLDEEDQQGGNRIIRLKLFTGTHWAVVQHSARNGLIQHQHGGKYTLDGPKLTTSTDFAGHSTLGFVGEDKAFHLEIEGDTMKQRDYAGQFNETWIRVR